MGSCCCSYAPVDAMSEEIRSEEVTIPRRGTPLPWLLLAVTLSVAVGIFAMARAGLNDERMRTANALKANDEVMGRLRTAASEYAKSQITVTELETRKEMLERQVADLDEKQKALAAELEALKTAKKKK